MNLVSEVSCWGTLNGMSTNILPTISKNTHDIVVKQAIIVPRFTKVLSRNPSAETNLVFRYRRFDHQKSFLFRPLADHSTLRLTFRP